MSETYTYIIWNKPVDHDMELPADIAISASVISCSSLKDEDEGLVILSDDPSYVVQEQEYEVTIDAALERNAAMLLQKGMLIHGIFYAGITISNMSNRGKRSIISVITTEKNTSPIRPMFEQLGYRIISLKCVRLDNFTLGTLAPGQWKQVKK